MKNFRMRYLLLPALLALLSGCGLPVFILLNMPESGDPAAAGKFYFGADADNSETVLVDNVDFLGFELYYRIYPSGADTDIDLKSREELLAKGFRRVSLISERKNDLDKPLIYIEQGDRGSNYSVTVDFDVIKDSTVLDVTLADPGEPVVDVPLSPPGTLTIRRAVFYSEAGSTDIFKRFNELAAGDADITTQIYNDLQTVPVPLVLYALSFGRAADFTEVYSVPLWIGELDISFPTLP
jgi:hypothetical protein